VSGALLLSGVSGEPVSRGVTSAGAIEVEGSVMLVKLDDAGTRLAVSTMRYPEGELQRNELHLYELPGSGTIVHRLTRVIADAVAVTLAPDGAQIAEGCGANVCIHDWGPGAVQKELAARGRRREIGALALRPDVGLLVAAQRNRMEILSWELRGDSHRSWAVAGAGERLREGLTPRLHGSPPWVPRWVGISPDGQRVASVRDDGTVSLWRRDGLSIKSLALSHYADIDPAFTPDGAVIALRSGDGRLAAVDVESERVVLTVEDSPLRHSVRRAALLFGGRAGYLAVSRPEGVVLHAIPSGDAAALVPIGDHVWRIAMSGHGRVVAVATQHRVTLWNVTAPSR